MLTEGGYRDALHFHPGHPVEFDTEAFIASRPPTMRPFLLTLLHLQAFEQFIHDRLDMLNCGRGFKGAFELEANNYVDIMDTQRRYTEWIKVVCHLFVAFGSYSVYYLFIFCACCCCFINSFIVGIFCTEKRKDA